MTGPEHYRTGQLLLAKGSGDATERGTNLLAAAQVHATLALAAAMALGADLDVPEWTEWRRVISKKGGRL